jgi:hypothetical protein
VLGDVVLDGLDQRLDAREHPASDALRRDVAEEALDHVEPGRTGRCEVHVEARVPCKPARHPFVLVCRVVVGDHVDLEVRRRLAVDHLQEAEPLLMTMARRAHAEHLPVQGVQRREESRGPVALVVVGNGLRAPTAKGQGRLGSIESLDLRLLVAAQDDRVGRRIEVEADNIAELLGELGVAADLEAAHQVRLEAVLAPDPANRRGAHLRSLRHVARAPLRSVGRRLLRRDAHDVGDLLGADGFRSTSAGRVLLDARDAQLGEPIAPEAHGLLERAQVLGDLLVLPALRRLQHDLRSQHQPRWRRSSARVAIEGRALLVRQFDRHSYTHRLSSRDYRTQRPLLNYRYFSRTTLEWVEILRSEGVDLSPGEVELVDRIQAGCRGSRRLAQCLGRDVKSIRERRARLLKKLRQLFVEIYGSPPRLSDLVDAGAKMRDAERLPFLLVSRCILSHSL